MSSDTCRDTTNRTGGNVEAEEAHGSPSGECLVCFDDITEETYCEYRVPGDSRWHPACFCYPCIQQLQQTQFKRYCDGVSHSTCAKEQRALLHRGPPINLSDPHAFPVAERTEVEALWIAATKQQASAKLEGSLTGEAREKLWNELQAFLIKDEQAEDSRDI
ncbi:uncharacterized protein LOC34618102 [Cyclospora cayetanensis]|uniref:Uncharacterized protein LOC34618102 n=1 Tax=Cyclospora cayetanensis TaxID=88456 RepID=A0A6P5WDF2_9EIME|nr:uncharacterized protein LOC34618102 [Cyclospora cayetanensis]